MKRYILFSSLFLLFNLLLTPASFAKQDLSSTELLSMIAQAKGKQAVLVNFYASWCPPCRKEIPHLIRLRKQFNNEELLIIGINLDRSQSIMQNFDKQFKINYPTFHDDGSIQSTYRVMAIPFTLIYSKSGKPVYAQAGFDNAEVLEKAITYGLE